jgi:hypothetical protein
MDQGLGFMDKYRRQLEAIAIWLRILSVDNCPDGYVGLFLLRWLSGRLMASAAFGRLINFQSTTFLGLFAAVLPTVSPVRLSAYTLVA